MVQPLTRKIVSPEQLAARRGALRAAGRRLVQCHGCFDIVHPGHVRYLQFARSLGDVLVVSLTADSGVSKGVDRPYIPQDLRAENLAALEFVDYVVIDSHPTACELLALVQPDVYVKGAEYAANQDPRFRREREIVESGGGRVVFHSGEVVFSSTRLIESMRDDASADACRLESFCARAGVHARGLDAALESIRDMPLVVIGDVVHETYVLCDARQAADDAPILAVQRLGETHYWGGAAAVALQAAALGARPVLATALGEDALSRRLVERMGAAEIPLLSIRNRAELPSQKTYVADDSKLLRVASGAPAPLDSEKQRELLAALHAPLRSAAAVLWCDLGLGTISSDLVAAVHAASGRGVFRGGAAGGAHGQLSGLRGCDLLVVGERRLREATRDMRSGVPAVAWNLLCDTASQAAMVVLHKRGVLSFDGRGTAGAAVGPPDASAARGPERVPQRRSTPQPDRLASEFVPSLAGAYMDTLGGEDAMFTIAALATAGGASLATAAYLASAIEALCVRRPGRSVVTADALSAWLARRRELAVASGFVPDEAAGPELARDALKTPAAHGRFVALDALPAAGARQPVSETVIAEAQS